MKKTIVLCSHARPIHAQTVKGLNALRRAGAAVIDHADAPTDVTLARNIGLTQVAEQLDHMPDRDLVLLVDDDMVFDLDDAQALADHARASDCAVSAMYVTAAGNLAASPLQAAGRWLTGLGLLALPARALLELRAASDRFVCEAGEKVAFTESGAEGGQYFSEDFTLCLRLGGVLLAPVPVGHVKQCVIFPSDDAVAAVRQGQARAATVIGRWRGAFLPPAESELTGVTEAEFAALATR